LPITQSQSSTSFFHGIGRRSLSLPPQPDQSAGLAGGILSLLDARHNILPEGGLSPASAFCSIVNLLALDTFGRPLPKAMKAAAMLARKRWKKTA
jgi:hypothetical protein